MKLSLILISLLIFGACTPKSGSDPSLSTQLSSAEMKVRGKEIYVLNCIACHNADPTKPGAIGPEVQGSSLELLQARILRADYPSGYTPRRQTKQMVALPHLEKEIPALQAFLAN